MLRNFPPRLSALFQSPEKFLLLIDYDGTLADEVSDPKLAVIPPETRDSLSKLYSNSPLRFVIVTGRPVSDIDGFMGGNRVPVLGGHGVEVRLDPEAPAAFLAEAMPEELRKTLCSEGQKYGCIVQDKLYSLSMHARDPAIYRELAKALEDTLCEHDLVCHVRQVGGTFDILQHHVNKGTGIAHLLERKNFCDLKPIYIGDDVLSDESVQALSDEGVELIPVGEDQAEGADDFFEGPGEVREFIFELTQKITVHPPASKSRSVA